MLQKIKQELKLGKTLLQFGFLKATGRALGMIAPLVIAKFFTKELFGSFSLAEMIVFFFTTLLITSAQTPFIVFANQEKIKTGKINKSFSIQCAFLTISIVAFLILNFAFSNTILKFTKIQRNDLFFMSFAFIGIAVKSFFCNLFMALGQRLKNALAELVFGGIIVSLVIALSLAGKLTLQTVFLTYFVSAFVVVAVFIKTINFNLLLPLDFDLGHFKEIFNFTKWLMLGTTAVYFINWGDNLVLRPFVPMGDIGAYNLGYKFFKGITTLTFVVNAYFLPFVSQNIGDSSKVRNYLFNKRPKILLLGLVFIGLLFVAAPFVFKLAYGDIYRDSVVVLRILLIGSVLAFYNSLYGPIIGALKEYKFQQITNVMQILLNVLLNLLLVPKMGIIGAAVATVSAYLCRSITIEFYFRIKLKKLLKI